MCAVQRELEEDEAEASKDAVSVDALAQSRAQADWSHAASGADEGASQVKTARCMS